MLAGLTACAEFVEMRAEEWSNLSPKKRKEMADTIADDLFFALGDEPTIAFGNVQIQYEQATHRIFIQVNHDETHIVKLI